MTSRARWRQDGQPVLVLALTAAVTLLVAIPLLFSPAGSAADAPSTTAQVGSALSAGSQSGSASQSVSSSSSSSLPGQKTPTDITLQAGPGTPAGDSRVVRMSVAGLERGYLLVPALGSYANHPRGLLVVLHQDIGSARAVAEGLGLDALRRSGVALAYPAGVGGSWNAGLCCGVAQRQDVDDVAFINAVLDDASRRTHVGITRRALLGYSGGGMLAYRLLCGPHPPLVAAVEVSGSLESPCPDLQLPDLLAVHGEKDGSVGLTTPIYVTHLRMSPRPVVSTLTTVTGLAGCRDRRTSVANGIELWRWPGCRSGSTVTAQIVPGAGHGWADVGGAARASGFLLPRLALTG